MSEISSGQPATNPAQTAAPSTTPESNAVPAAPETPAQNVVPENNANGQTETQQPVLTADESKYLQSQNIDLAKYGIDQSNHEAVDNFINLHKSMRQQKGEEKQQQTQATPQDLVGQSQTMTQPTQPQAPVQQQTAPAPQPVAPTQHVGPSQLDIINMKSYLDNNYPDIKDRVGTKEFYDGMRNLGFAPVSANGEFNVSSILRYADILNTKAENERLKAQINQPNPNLIPDPSNKIDISLNSLQASGTKLDMNAASNIVIAYNQAQRAGKTLTADDVATYNAAVNLLQGK